VISRFDLLELFIRGMLSTLKYHFIRTPLERPLMFLRETLKLPGRLRHPELAEIYKESGRIQQVLSQSLTTHSNCLDVGAHYGSMLSAFVRLAPRGQHIAIEAIPEKADFLRRKFPEVRVYSLALSSQSGKVDFYVNTRRSGFSGMAKHGSPQEKFRRITVPCDRLDSLIPRSPRIDFVKIDVEGAEDTVLRGGTSFIADHRPLILFECTPSGTRAFGKHPSEVFEFLTDDLGYEIYFLKDFLQGGSPVDLETFADALVYPFQAFNWIARPAN